ncbi:ImuA family protein [Humitalea sp. 24SJ18S-53]|uniref:ImuA family protein n=1 Tax=Humitalea sp. 24SJ18S-53 TaxID=3422307 RepID=UPI003D670817
MPKTQPVPDRPSIDQPALLAALRARVIRLEGAGRAAHDTAAIPVCDGLGLPGGGLARATLHEILAAEPGCGAAFAAVLLARSGGTVLWIGAGTDALTAWPPGLARFGLLPAKLILLRAERWSDALWAMEEALGCPAVAGALLAPDWHADPAAAALDLTASRRLQLAAEAGGGIGLLLRPDMANPPPSAAASRWRISALNAAGAGHGMGDPCWQLELLRLRGGRPGGPWAVTWRAAAGRMERDAAA